MPTTLSGNFKNKLKDIILQSFKDSVSNPEDIVVSVYENAATSSIIDTKNLVLADPKNGALSKTEPNIEFNIPENTDVGYIRIIHNEEQGQYVLFKQKEGEPYTEEEYDVWLSPPGSLDPPDEAGPWDIEGVSEEEIIDYIAGEYPPNEQTIGFIVMLFVQDGSESFEAYRLYRLYDSKNLVNFTVEPAIEFGNGGKLIVTELSFEIGDEE